VPRGMASPGPGTADNTLTSPWWRPVTPSEPLVTPGPGTGRAPGCAAAGEPPAGRQGLTGSGQRGYRCACRRWDPGSRAAALQRAPSRANRARPGTGAHGSGPGGSAARPLGHWTVLRAGDGRGACPVAGALERPHAPDPRRRFLYPLKNGGLAPPNGRVQRAGAVFLREWVNAPAMPGDGQSAVGSFPRWVCASVCPRSPGEKQYPLDLQRK
jgi:hypothetical protein